MQAVADTIAVMGIDRVRRRRGALALGLLAVIASACGPVVEVEPIGAVRLAPPQETSQILAADGSVLAELHAEQDREVVPLAQIPQVLRSAVIAVEDRRFYDHGGVDGKAIARAIVENTRSGRIRQGGSTITQQLAKNAVVGNDPTLERKLEEAGVALQLERQFTKDEILEQYLNTVYFGNGAYGAQTASRRYFGADVSDLTLGEAGLLAALLKAPATYDPYRHPEVARRRRNMVLRLMAEQGLASETAVSEAIAADLVLEPLSDPNWRAPYYVDHVLDELQHDPAFKVLGDTPAARAAVLFRGGVTVETALDPEWQVAAEQAVAATLSEPTDPHAAIVAVDPLTGGIRTIVGGRDYTDPLNPFAKFNLATDGRRQPGSVFKEVVLATAIAQGHSLDEEFEAGPRVVIGPRPGEPQPYAVSNYDRRDYGELSLRDATAHSVNVVYAQLISVVGPDAVVATARDLGIRTPLQPLRSLALGAQEVSPLEMASVQATLAAGGVYRPPSAVIRILAGDGDVLYRRKPPAGKQVIDKAVAYLTTDALRGVVQFGTGERANLQRPMAGKTGTTQRGADAWFVGYTPSLAAAVWIGFPEGAVSMEPPRTRIRVEGGNWPAEIFARFGSKALAEVPAEEFPRPGLDLVTVRVDTSRNCLPNPYTPPGVIAQRSYLTGTEPTDTCTEPTGPPTTDVPSVVGLPLHAATRLLTDAGFTVQRRPTASVELPPGYIVRQDPEPGAAQRLQGGYRVRVWVSTSDQATAIVPDVVDRDVVDARNILEDAGFAVVTVAECPPPSCEGGVPGSVWRQDPYAHDQVPAHSQIRLWAWPSD